MIKGGGVAEDPYFYSEFIYVCRNVVLIYWCQFFGASANFSEAKSGCWSNLRFSMFDADN